MCLLTHPPTHTPSHTHTSTPRWTGMINIARIANAAQCHSLLSGNKDCHEFRFLIVRIVISVSNVTSLQDCLNVKNYCQNCQHFSKLSKLTKIVKNCQKFKSCESFSTFLKIVKIFKKKIGQVMSPQLSDQVFQRSLEWLFVFQK